MRFCLNGTRDVVFVTSTQMMQCLKWRQWQQKKTLEQRRWWFQRLGWLARFLENNVFRKRTSCCWWGGRRVCRNGYFLDWEDKWTDWRLLIGKHLKYGQIWLVRLFLKALTDKGIVEKGKQAKSGKKLKQRLTDACFLLMQLGKVWPTHCHLKK